MQLLELSCLNEPDAFADVGDVIGDALKIGAHEQKGDCLLDER